MAANTRLHVYLVVMPLPHPYPRTRVNIHTDLNITIMLIISSILPYSSNTSSSIVAIHFIITLQMLKEKYGKEHKQMHMTATKRVKRMCTVLQKIIFILLYLILGKSNCTCSVHTQNVRELGCFRKFGFYHHPHSEGCGKVMFLHLSVRSQGGTPCSLVPGPFGEEKVYPQTGERVFVTRRMVRFLRRRTVLFKLK